LLGQKAAWIDPHTEPHIVAAPPGPKGLEAEALDTTQGVTISVQPRGARLHVEAKATTG
jgi:hypothetical protein